MIVAFKL